MSSKSFKTKIGSRRSPFKTCRSLPPAYNPPGQACWRSNPAARLENCHRCAQRGATLIIALLVVAVVAMLATGVGRDFQFLFRQVDNAQREQQASAWLRGAEALARQALLVDLALSPFSDTPDELWARRLEVPLPEGLLSGCLEDLQGRLNLNALGGAPDGPPTAMQARFIRLLQLLELEAPLDQAAALALANAVFDWLDADSDVRRPGGAEDLEYLQAEPPRRPANQAFHSVSELRLVQGVTEEIYRALTPHLTVWGNGALNLNGLAGDALLRALGGPAQAAPLSPEGAALIEARLGQGGVAELAAFGREPLSRLGIDLEGLGLRSDTFLLRAQLEYQDRTYRQESVLERGAGPGGVPRVSVLSRGAPGDGDYDYCAD